ncbi:putative ubiquitination network signaling protein acrB [Fulvia fulva]|uniref:Ubiquitination network signaling protein acrB n=1 Tax=Passalora fulva TaxID=5499 RepID=A0A9Q8PIX5_PASFU|nr:putative ubiquitination network signaling protein acrB [Fulvia fulva]KAK4611850.1 putative ubiquitination network signaling protein acrB [Fulvia fulva]KAK4612676.1 putative ubiquitination network signaling protein acrB [Fulvia fulva]UJO23406.1 putative ubiquitination network signaling protein acrB [Fulvia fulva]WPV20943.1 putative ubiquitination network signaling protein acrB [Fulvia fulva]WPV36465.1 putative ubiquitination network signaling protein acrB [Fulvia fulva]
MPQKGKTKNAPNQHDKRHENGLAPPGKRVTRQRSNGQLNGEPNGNGKPTAASVVTPPALPSRGLNQGFKFPRPADTTASAPDSAAAARKDYASRSDSAERDRTSSNASAESVGPCGEMADQAHEQTSTTPSAEVPPAVDNNGKAYVAPARGTLSAVSTILTYYPLRDAISILILLLSLPPTLVLVIQALFASLTFVPPTAGISLSTLPNIKEMFNSSNFGYPAMFTIFMVDVLFWVCWSVVWKPVQNIFLDLSHAVVAVSLSGAAATTGGPTYSIATCSIIVCVVHVLRYKAIHLTALDYLRSVLHKLDIGLPLDAPSFATSFNSVTPLERGMAMTAIRTILGIHIVSQGVTTCIRRTLANAKANEKDQTLPAITKTDTEATAGAEHPNRSPTGLSDGLQPPHLSGSTDGRPPGQPPAPKNRESSSKKKRKQANQVRSQQPLWAAIASTKVTFVKEMEQRDAADDAREAAAMDNNTTNPFVSATNTTTDRIWICEVRDTEIIFAVELSPETAAENADDKDQLPPVSTGIDRSKPFFIRINGAAWSSTRIMSSQDGEDATDRYVGEIFGLAPRSSYLCEVVSIANQKVLCFAGLITQPARTPEQAAAGPPPPQHQALRPSSPITTLKQSIMSAQAKLDDVRNRGRKTKKDQRAAHADIKKEINTLRSKLDSSAIDDRQKGRQQQLSQHKNQAEEATADIKSQIQALGEIPADQVQESEVKKRAYESALKAKKAAERDFEEAKAEQDRELDALKNEIKAFESKKEKLAAKSAQRAYELEKLQREYQAKLSAKQKQDLERHQRQKEHEKVTSMIAQMEAEANSHMSKANDAYAASAALQRWSTQPPPGYPGYSSPPTPEGALPGSNGQISPQANGFPPGAFSQPFGSPFQHHASPAGAHARPGGVHRGRSSSMLSQYSGFTDNGDDFTFIPGDHRHQNSWSVQPNAIAGATEERKASEGDNTSGSGSGGASLMNGSTNGSNSPRPEAKPFIPGAAAKPVGTIGPPSKKAPQSPTAMHAGAAGNGR